MCCGWLCCCCCCGKDTEETAAEGAPEEPAQKAITEQKELAKKVASLEETYSRIQGMETRMYNIEEGVQMAWNASAPPSYEADSARLDSGLVAAYSAPPVSPVLPPTSVLEAAERGDAEAMLTLLAAAPDTQQRDQRGNTALHLAAAQGNPRVVQILLQAGAPAHTSGPRLRTPLHNAAAQGHLEAAQSLLVAGAQVEPKDVDDMTPLSLAIQGGHVRMVALLLDNGASLEASSKKTEKPVFLAVSCGQLVIVALLLQKESSVDVCGKEGETLLVYAAKAKHWDIVKFLLGQEVSATKCTTPKESALALAAEAGEVDIVRELLKRGAATQEAQLKNALEVAKTAAVVWSIVDAAPSVVQGDGGELGLLFAACNGMQEPLVALLEAGVNVNAGGETQLTALHVAAMAGHTACVAELLSRGAAVDAVDKDLNQTPLHLAASYGHVDIVRALLAAGASATIVNKEGKTPVDVTESEAVREAFRNAQ